jgi:hypothetical protein
MSAWFCFGEVWRRSACADIVSVCSVEYAATYNHAYLRVRVKYAATYNHAYLRVRVKHAATNNNAHLSGDCLFQLEFYFRKYNATY